MDAGPKVGRRIRFPQKSNHAGKYIVAGHFAQPQMMSVWPKRRHNQEYSHAGKQKGADSVVFRFVFKKEKGNHDGNVGKP